MSRKHFFLYDVLLPLAGVLFLGHLFSDRFDTAIFRWLDSVKAFGLGEWFGRSDFREKLWTYSWLLFAAMPALAWMVWVRINLEYDWVNGRRRLDRPIYTLFRNFFRWIEGGGELLLVRQAYERRLAAELDRVRRLEAELAGAEGTGDSFESATETGEEWRDGYLPPSSPR
jgi:hypothetical protein